MSIVSIVDGMHGKVIALTFVSSLLEEGKRQGGFFLCFGVNVISFFYRVRYDTLQQ
jgi:hypothetical protein